MEGYKLGSAFIRSVLWITDRGSVWRTVRESREFENERYKRLVIKELRN